LLKIKRKAAPNINTIVRKHPLIEDISTVTDLLEETYHFSKEETAELLASGHDGILAVWEVVYPGIVLVLLKNNEDLCYFSRNLKDENGLHEGKLDNKVKVMYGPHPKQIRKAKQAGKST